MMLEVLRQDYIRTAWAKGLHARTVVVRHALRNALIPVVTLVGLQAPLLIGGAVIIEQIFVIPGMGLLLLDAVNQRDYPIITGVFLIVGVAVMLINLLVDLSYGLLDPEGEVPLMATSPTQSRSPCAPRRGPVLRSSLRLFARSRSARPAARCSCCSCSAACSPTCSRPTA